MEILREQEGGWSRSIGDRGGDKTLGGCGICWIGLGGCGGFVWFVMFWEKVKEMEVGFY